MLTVAFVVIVAGVPEEVARGGTRSGRIAFRNRFTVVVFPHECGLHVELRAVAVRCRSIAIQHESIMQYW